MITLVRPCPNCGKAANYRFYERIYQKRLYWSDSWNCQNCGYITEGDDSGKLPEDLRALVIAKDGLWGLELHSNDGKSLKALRQVMEIPLKELTQKKAKIPLLIYEGTLREVEYYLGLFLDLAPGMVIIMKKLKP